MKKKKENEGKKKWFRTENISGTRLLGRVEEMYVTVVRGTGCAEPGYQVRVT